VTICSASSAAHPATGTLVFTASTIASAGGTQTFTIPAGGCTPRIFWPLGVSVTVIENVPANYAVTAIALTPTKGGPGTTSVISAATVSAGTATVTIGSGQATLTFTTSGPASSKPLCVVPNVFGLALTAARSAIRKAHCAVGTLRKVYSDLYYPGRVFSQSPPRGTVLAHGARVTLTVSLGHHP
jgi:hypothetical protein